MPITEMNRDEIIEKLKTGIHNIVVDDVTYHATLDEHYIPYLDTNAANMRKNYSKTLTVTFFDCCANAWKTFNTVTSEVIQ